MKYADSDGYKIHYKIAGNGVPVVLIFGFGMSLEEWFEFGYAGKLAGSHFKVIAVEPRGHGKSKGPHSPDDYSLKKLTEDVTAVLNREDIQQAHILGYSLGAKIALGVANYHPERVQSLILGAFGISSQVNLSDDIVSKTLQSGATEWRTLWESLLNVPPLMGRRLEKVDTKALLALRQKEAEWGSLEPVLKSLNVPVLLFAGRQCFTYKDMKRVHSLIDESELLIEPDEDHFTFIPSMNPVIERAIRFLRESS